MATVHLPPGPPAAPMLWLSMQWTELFWSPLQPFLAIIPRSPQANGVDHATSCCCIFLFPTLHTCREIHGVRTFHALKSWPPCYMACATMVSTVPSASSINIYLYPPSNFNRRTQAHCCTPHLPDEGSGHAPLRSSTPGTSLHHHGPFSRGASPPPLPIHLTEESFWRYSPPLGLSWVCLHGLLQLFSGSSSIVSKSLLSCFLSWLLRMVHLILLLFKSCPLPTVPHKVQFP